MKNNTINAFRALAHDIRLDAFRLLVKKGPDGLPAGKIAAELEVPSSTLSTHLSQLEHANLISSWREQQKILYCINWQGVKQLTGFLLDDCCQGNPEACGYNNK